MVQNAAMGHQILLYEIDANTTLETGIMVAQILAFPLLFLGDAVSLARPKPTMGILKK